MTRRERFVTYGYATWFGCGLVPLAPGTTGTFGALPLYVLVRPFGPVGVLLTAFVVSAFGVVASNGVVRDQGEEDPQIIVVDEVAGVLVTLAAAPTTVRGMAVAVLLFRLFDQFKPWPVDAAEDWPEGWGVMGDDLVAGTYGALVIMLMQRFGYL